MASVRRCRIRPVDSLRQRRQPVIGPRFRPPQRDGDSRRVGRGTIAGCASIAGRERNAGCVGRRVRIGIGALGHSVSGRSPNLLCPLLTSATSSRRLSATLAQGKMADLPGYCALTFPLMPAAFTSKLSVQVLDFEECCLLIQLCRLLCGFYSSGQRFACGFLQIPPRDGHPCRSANDSPCRVRRGLSPPNERALPGAQHKWRSGNPASPGKTEQ